MRLIIVPVERVRSARRIRLPKGAALQERVIGELEAYDPAVVRKNWIVASGLASFCNYGMISAC